MPSETVEEICRLKREVYPDFSVRHFHEFATEKHGIRAGYTWTKDVLQMYGLAEKSPGRGSTGASGSGGRWWGCCSTSTRRRTPGCPAFPIRTWS